MRAAADKLEPALGHEVKVRPRGGEVAVEIRLADLDEALALARKLSRKPLARPRSRARSPPRAALPPARYHRPRPGRLAQLVRARL